MLMLCLIVLGAVAVLFGIRWELRHRLALSVTGLLSAALGVRIVALATALYVFPLSVTLVLGDDDPDVLSATEATVAEVPLGEDEASPLSYGREPIQSVAKVVYLAKNRPAWIDDPPSYEKDVLKVAVLGGPFPSLRACERQLAEEVEQTVAEFINQHVGAERAASFIHFSVDELRRRKVIRDQFKEQLETSLGLMNQVHAQLVFDDAFRDEVDLRWSEIRARSRLAQTGLGAGVILLLLGTMFSYFRLDTATKGYYTGRLQFATAGTILALVAASVLLAKWIPWM